MGFIVCNHNFSNPGATIIVGAHNKAVGSRPKQAQIVPFGYGEFAILTQKVAAFAYRANHIILALRVIISGDWLYVHPSSIQRGTQHVIHCSINNSKIFVIIRFEILNLSQQNACIGGH